jgi:hypothetical protein
MTGAPAPGRLSAALEELARDVPVTTDLLAGSLARAGRRRRRQAAGTCVVTAAAVAAAVTIAQMPWAPSGGQRPAVIDGARPSSTVRTPQVVGTVAEAAFLVFRGRDVFAVDAATGDERKVLRMSEQAAGMLPYPNVGSLSPDGKRLAVPSSALGEAFSGVTGVWIVDLSTGEGRLHDTEAAIGSVTWSPDGTKLFLWKWGGGGAWVLADGDVRRVPGVADVALWAGDSDHLIDVEGWRVLDLAGRVERTLPQLRPYSAPTATWRFAEFGGSSPDGRRLAVIRRDTTGVSFGAVGVATGRIVRSWGPMADDLNTQNVIGWKDADTMLAIARAPGEKALRLLELDVETGRSTVARTFDGAISAYAPAS